jgi:hypothetical protein
LKSGKTVKIRNALKLLLVGAAEVALAGDGEGRTDRVGFRASLKDSDGEFDPGSG